MRAPAREDEEKNGSGGGGVGYAVAGAMRWKTDCANAFV